VASFSIRFNEGELNKGIRKSLMAQDGEVRKDVRRRARNVREAAKANVRSMTAHPTGRLASSISFSTVEPRGPDTVAAQVGSDLPYARFVHDGTGVYGPTGSPIVPTSKPLLVFDSRRASSVIRAYEVLGQKPKPYLERALRAAVD
jgi:hypothetical protein